MGIIFALKTCLFCYFSGYRPALLKTRTSQFMYSIVLISLSPVDIMLYNHMSTDMPVSIHSCIHTCIYT